MDQTNGKTNNTRTLRTFIIDGSMFPATVAYKQLKTTNKDGSPKLSPYYVEDHRASGFNPFEITVAAHSERDAIAKAQARGLLDESPKRTLSGWTTPVFSIAVTETSDPTYVDAMEYTCPVEIEAITSEWSARYAMIDSNPLAEATGTMNRDLLDTGNTLSTENMDEDIDWQEGTAGWDEAMYLNPLADIEHDSNPIY